MYCRVLACDYDGTGAARGRLAPEVAGVLGAARGRGWTTLLVTGRVLEDLQAAAVDFTVFDAVVAENGAVVWLPALERVLELGAPPPERFLGELRARGVPFHAGAVVVGTWDRHAADLLDIVRRLGLPSQLTFNRAALMVLPSGVDKALGVRRALAELGRSERNMVVFGDAENDLPLFAAAELAVAARGSVPAVAEAADERLALPGSQGVAHRIEALLERDGVVATPARHRLVLGEDDGGARVAVPASGASMLVSGDPRSGKSWLTGLVVEQLLEAGYRVCVVDPEGDYGALGQRPHVLALGRDLPLPRPAAVPRVLRDQPLSVVLDLSGLPHGAQRPWVDELLPALAETRAATGLPHWLVVDEAHYFFPAGSRPCPLLESPTGNVLLVTYRPSLLAAEAVGCLGIHLLMQTAVEDERYFVTGLLQARGPRDLLVPDALAGLGPGRVGLLVSGPEGGAWHVFTPRGRLTVHAHHGRKYADDRLPDDKAFRFLHADGAGHTAHNAAEFAAAVAKVPSASLRHHLLAGDFSRWAEHVLGDVELARGLRKLEHGFRAGANPSAEEIVRHVRDRYLI